MKIVLKLLVLILWIGLGLGMLQLWFQTVIMGNYFASGSILMNTLAVVALLAGVAVFVYVVKIIFKWDSKTGSSLSALLLIGLIPIFAGCDRGSANVQTLITDDCGISWRLIPPGQAIPTRMGPCAYKVTIPDYPMQGETRFKTSFKDRVLANVEIAYEYAIFDGKAFISEAKYIGKANSESDDATNAANAYESAENAVIDKRIREAASDMLLAEDIVDFSQGEFEDRLLEAVNKLLAIKGVRLNFISFVPTPEEQTRLAIDMMTAMKVYESKGLGDLGKAVATARAGAPQIHISSTNEKDKK